MSADDNNMWLVEIIEADCDDIIDPATELDFTMAVR